MLLSTLANSIAAEHVGDDVAFTNVSTDTRSIQPGDLFVALKGERFDAHEFLDQAVAAGASALMVSSPVNQSVPQIVVADTRQGLGQLSQAWLAQFNPKKVAITGSCGKTSVKEMTAAILKEEGEVLATQGNFNNDIGVPLTLCRVREEHRFAVIEMGANHVGEIDYVSNLVRPDVALVNNVGPAHLEGFGSIENVARAKGEIYKNLAQAGLAVVNLDDVYAEYFLKQLEGKACLGFSMCSTNSDADIVLAHCDIENDGSCSFSVSVCGEQLTVKLGLLGKNNVSNALAAMALSKAVGASTQSMVKGLSALTPVKGRLCAVKDIRSFHVIDDSYNANPASMRSAIDLLASLENKTVLVLGDMAELGSDVEREHEGIGQYAAQMGVSALYALGRYADEYKRGFQTHDGNRLAYVANDYDQLAEMLMEHEQGSTLLVKGSRSAAMENVIHCLTKLENTKEGSH